MEPFELCADAVERIDRLIETVRGGEGGSATEQGIDLSAELHALRESLAAVSWTGL